jgi:hypothetical protein
MKKMILILLFLINSFYYIYYIFNIENAMLINKAWTLIFVLGIIVSVSFMFQKMMKTGINHILSLAVLITSIASLGAFGFRNFISGFF